MESSRGREGAGDVELASIALLSNSSSSLFLTSLCGLRTSNFATSRLGIALDVRFCKLCFTTTDMPRTASSKIFKRLQTSHPKQQEYDRDSVNLLISIHSGTTDLGEGKC